MLGQAAVQTNIGISRPDAARAFYVDTLGLSLKSEDAFALVVSAGDGDIRLAKVPMVAPAPYAVVSFAVPDLAAFVAAAAKKGVKLERFPFLPADGDGVWTAPDGTKVCWTRDPDMNLIGVVQPA
ncbi:MAG: hypothetical protein NW203_07945 [Hyphomonadaceae bacterium]|nr:hypothetical protein [Hyphomonadaceae bacterium]